MPIWQRHGMVLTELSSVARPIFRTRLCEYLVQSCGSASLGDVWDAGPNVSATGLITMAAFELEKRLGHMRSCESYLSQSYGRGELFLTNTKRYKINEICIARRLPTNKHHTIQHLRNMCREAPASNKPPSIPTHQPKNGLGARLYTAVWPRS